jgi:large subunit ribosomal protein L29
MAINKQDIQSLSTEDLLEKVQEERVLYKKLKFNHAISSLDNPLLLRAKRRDIAKLLTELRKRELESSEK